MACLEPINTWIGQMGNAKIDGASIVPCSNGKILVWDAIFAPSYLATATSGPSLVAASAEDGMRSEYSFLEHSHILSLHVAIETSGIYVVPTLHEILNVHCIYY